MADSDAQRRLRDLIRALHVYRAELGEAKRKGLDFVAERSLEEIGKREAMIRRHCDAWGLVVPPEVREDRKAAPAKRAEPG